MKKRKKVKTVDLISVGEEGATEMLSGIVANA